FCNIDRDSVIENRTIKVLYEVPLMLEKQHMADVVIRKLGLHSNKPDLTNWKKMVKDAKHLEKKVTIGMVGKYVRLHDAYLSVVEALTHGGYANSCKIHIKWIDSETVTPENIERKLGDCYAIIVPGGFGPRGIYGMILTAQYCRENDVPYLGICLGMQVATIEFARNVAHMKGAHSREFDENSPYKVIDYLPDQNDNVDKGGTLRLGVYECNLTENTLIRSLYGADTIFERHRHRYEFNNEFRQRLIDNGLTVSGTYRNGYIVETVELADHSYYIGVQFHPEFKSRPDNPHPLFRGLVKAALNHKESKYD
ncbi:MAG: CTP synthase, partial [Erysipelotrichaceae bacterium]|nr:CTP synthase [Erysipelotrichaceae bacterium]